MTQLADGIFYSVRRSDRARRVRITVEASRGVEVVLPRRAAERDAAAAVRELRPWIERRLREVDEQHAMIAARGDSVPYLGGSLTLIREGGRTRVARRGQTLLTPEGEARTPALERWYRRMAKVEVAPRVERAAAQLGSGYTTLSIRGQKTRWGSCSAAGALSFNWRLLLAPEPVLDYVVWHEVCHLQAMNHSPGFWSLVAAHCPDYREHAAWLRRHGGTLVL